MKTVESGNMKTRWVKLLVLLWFLIPIVVAGIAIYGWNIGDITGGVLLSFLPASLVTVLSVVVASTVESSVSKLARYIWLMVSLAALLAAICFAVGSTPDALKGAETLLAYIMLIMSFPFGFLVPYLLMTIAFLWGDGGIIFRLSGMWLCFLVAGYLQWFVLLPWLLRKWRRQ